MDNSKITIKPGPLVEEEDLISYYAEKYPNRLEYLKNHWRWHYNIEFANQQLPRVLLYQGKMIGQASGIPFNASINGKKFHGQWFVDFSIAPNFQRSGLGMMVGKDYINQAIINVAHANEKSLSLLKKIGWTQGYPSHRHYFFIKPFNHHQIKSKISGFIRKPLNLAAKLILYPLYKIHSVSLDQIKVEPVNEENLKSFIHSERKGENIFTTFRDKEFLTWRFLNSPDSKNYKIFFIDPEHGAIIKTKNNFVQILMLKEPLDDNLYIKIVATICFWALCNDFNYVVNYTTVRSRHYKMKKLLSYSIHQRYAFYSVNKDLQKFMDNAQHYWEMADSDLEKF